MATKRKTKRKGIITEPLVTNPFDAAKRKKLALLNIGKNRKKKVEENNNTESNNNNNNNNKSSAKPPIARSNTFCSSLPFESQQTENYSNHSNHSNHSNNNHEYEDSTNQQSQSWLQYRRMDTSQSIDYNYLTPMDQPQQTHCSQQFDIMNNRIFNHTKSKIKSNDNKNDNIINNNDDNKMEYIARKDLKIPLKNEYLDLNEKIDILSYKKRQKGIVLNERYNIYYEEIELLGNGSFGKVYKCRNRDDGCFYAIKKIKIQSIHNNYLFNNEHKEKYMKEGLVLSALQRNGNLCKNIILYNSMWIENNYFYLVTEYCDNGNLYNLYNLFTNNHNKQNELTEDIFCKIIENISNALLFIHNKGFVHFDVKPENILISKNGIFKLADFGLCTKIIAEFDNDYNAEIETEEIRERDKENIDKTKNNNNNIPAFIEGDARYLCRELIEETYNIQQLDKIDIFSLGCSIYEMIIGQDLPSNGFKWQQIRNGNLSWNNNKNMKHNINISSNMKQLIITMMHSNPNERPSSKQLTIFLRKFNDIILQEKEKQIENLKQKIQILMQQTQQMR